MSNVSPINKERELDSVIEGLDMWLDDICLYLVVYYGVLLTISTCTIFSKYQTLTI